MPTAHAKQNSFIAGLITHEAVERADKPQIYHGLDKADNVRIDSHGGASRRPGTTLIGELPHHDWLITTGFSIIAPNGGDTDRLINGPSGAEIFKTTTPIPTSNEEYKCFWLIFNVVGYVEYFDLRGAYIDHSDPDQISLDHSCNIAIDVVDNSLDGNEKRIRTITLHYGQKNKNSYRIWIGETIKEILVRYIGGTEVLDSSYFAAEQVQLYRDGEDGNTGFRLTTLNCGATANYLLILTQNAVTIYRNNRVVAECPLTNVDAQYLPQLKFCSYGESVIVTHKEIAPFMIQRHLSDDDWRVTDITFSKIPDYNAELKRTALSGEFAVVESNGTYLLRGSSSAFTDSDVGCIVSGNGGVGRIILVNSATEARITVINKFAFYGDTPKRTGWTIDRNMKPLWGPTYGYPECAAIFANRLFLGGCKRAPDVIAASVVGDYLNFSTGDLQSDDAMVVRLSTGRHNHHIRYIASYDNLEVFTDLGVFTLRRPDSGATTDLASSFYLQKNIRIDPFIEPFRTDDSGTIFLRYGRSDIRELSYSTEIYSYGIRSLSLWYTDAVRNTRAIALSGNTTDNVTTYVYCVRDDGGIGCLNFLLTDNIHVATNWITDGRFISCTSTLQAAYVVVARNGHLLLEQIDNEAVLDSEKRYYNCTGGRLSGLDHLIGCSVQVRADNEYLGEYIVDDDGGIDIPAGDWQVVHVGLGFTCTISPLPPESSQDSIMGKWVRYSQAVISVYNTQEIKVNSSVPEFLGREYSGYNQTPLIHKTGRYRVLFGTSENLRPVLTITQDKPLDFNIRSVAYDVEVN